MVWWGGYGRAASDFGLSVVPAKAPAQNPRLLEVLGTAAKKYSWWARRQGFNRIRGAEWIALGLRDRRRYLLCGSSRP